MMFKTRYNEKKSLTTKDKTCIFIIVVRFFMLQI